MVFMRKLKSNRWLVAIAGTVLGGISLNRTLVLEHSPLQLGTIALGILAWGVVILVLQRDSGIDSEEPKWLELAYTVFIAIPNLIGLCVIAGLVICQILGL